MRKLATIRRITAISSIPNADAIEVAQVDNWKVVIRKGEFNVGDLVVYCEVDSWIPHSIAPFLSNGKEPNEYQGIKGERLRTVKLRGQISQGLILPITFDLQSDFDCSFFNFEGARKLKEGDDVTDILGIVKYEPPIPACLDGVVVGPFPFCLPKTDENRIQNLTNQYSELQQYEYEVTEKLEGTSMSVGVVPHEDDFEFVVCGHKLNFLESPTNIYWAVAQHYGLKTKMLNNSDLSGLVLQGELIGNGIQGNYYNLTDGVKINQGSYDFYVFAIYDTMLGRYVEPELRYSICSMLQVKHVPVIHRRLSIANSTIDDLLADANGTSVLVNKLREGLVYKRADGSDGQEHFKCISNEYLLKTGKHR